MSKKNKIDYNLCKYERISISAHLDRNTDTECYIELTDWANCEGFDATVIRKNKTESFSLTWLEYILLKKLAKKLDKFHLINSTVSTDAEDPVKFYE